MENPHLVLHEKIKTENYNLFKARGYVPKKDISEMELFDSLLVWG